MAISYYKLHLRSCSNRSIPTSRSNSQIDQQLSWWLPQVAASFLALDRNILSPRTFSWDLTLYTYVNDQLTPTLKIIYFVPDKKALHRLTPEIIHLITIFCSTTKYD